MASRSRPSRRGTAAALACAAVCIVAGLAPRAAMARNVLSNGDFEQTTPEGMPEGWTFTTWGRLGPAQGGVSKKAAHTGKQGLWLASDLGPVDFAAYSPGLDLSGCEEALVSFYYRTRGAPRPSVAFASFGPEFAERRWQAPLIQYERRNLALTKRWRLATWRIAPCPKASMFLVLFHVADSGMLFVDDARVAPRPGRLTCDVVVPGVVSRLPGTRLLRARLTNPTDEDVAGRALLTATEASGKAVYKEAPFKVRAGSTELFEIEYSVPGDQAHEVQLAFTSADRREVYDARPVSPRPMLELKVTRPAFRNTVLATIPFDGLVARLRANATDELSGRLAPTASLVGDIAGEPAIPCEVSRGASPTVWEIRSEGTALADGHYTLHARVALPQGKTEALSADVWVRPRRRLEVGYDDAGRLLVSGKPTFPVGVMGVYRADELPHLREARFTFIVSPQTAAKQPMLEQAHALGLKVVVSAPYTEPTRWAGILTRLRDNPAVLGWMGPPEPDRLQLPVGAPSTLRAALAQRDPYRPVLVMFGLPDGPARYPDAGDVFLVGAAPVPYWPLETLATRVKAAVEEASGKPVWAVIQTHSRADTGVRSASLRGSGRPPSPAEQRCLTYIALAAGARGIVYSAYSIAPTSQTRRYLIRTDAPELWESVGRTNEELAILAPYFLAADAPEPLDFSNTALRGAVFRHGKRALVIVVNPGLREASAEVRLPLTPEGPIKPLFGGGADVGVAGDVLGGFFPPLTVSVCELGIR